MNNSKRTKNALVSSVVALAICFSMFVGTTMAWFTDTATTAVNTIQAGILKVQLLDEADNDIEGKELTFADKNGNTENLRWEPGVTFVTNKFKVKNDGDLAFKFKMFINGINGDSELLEVISFTVVDGSGNVVATENEIKLGVGKTTGAYAIQGHMDENAGNKYQGMKLEGIAITVSAAQDTVEFDTTTNEYDKDAKYDEKSYTYASVTTVDNKLTLPEDKSDLVLSDNDVTAVVPAGTQLDDGVNKMELIVEETDVDGTITIEVGEKAVAYNVEVTGVASTNDKLIKVVLDGDKALDPGLTGVKAYNKGEELTANPAEGNPGFVYDSVTGVVTLYVTHFCDFVFVYDAEANENAPKAYVSRMKAEELAVKGYKYNGSLSEELNLELDFGYIFKATETVEEIKGTEYEYWIADFYVSADKDVEAGEIYLAGNYKSDAFDFDDNWIAITGDVEANTEFALLEAFGYGGAVRYKDVCGFYEGFKCGAFVEGTSNSTTITVKLVLTNPENANEQILICTCTETI